MFALVYMSRVAKFSVLAACASALSFSNALAQAPAEPDLTAPSALLSIDLHRDTVIDRIIAEWGESLERSQANLGRAQLRVMLLGLRADHLLAASLAGSLSGLRDVLAQALTTTTPSTLGQKQTKALGDGGQDLVYSPRTPCRLFDTRSSQGGLGTPTLGVRRTYGATTPVLNQGGPGGCAAAAGAAVALIQIGTLAPSGNGLLQGGPQGAASFPNALILYQAGDQYGTAVAMPLNPANGRFDLVEQFATADLYGDLLGYFAPPVATALQCTQVNGPSTSIAVSSETLVALPSCAAGYTRTGTSCSGTANIPGGYLVETNAAGCRFRNLSSVTPYNANATSTCCRIPGS